MIRQNISLEDMLNDICIDNKYAPNPIELNIVPVNLEYFNEEGRPIWLDKCVREFNALIPSCAWLDYCSRFPYSTNYALENAFGHGNKWNPNLPIRIAAYLGQEGIVYEIEDSGSGFNLASALNNPHIKAHKYNRGLGLKKMSQAPELVSFNNKGNVCRIQALRKDFLNELNKDTRI